MPTQSVRLACPHGHVADYSVRAGGQTTCKTCRAPGACQQCGPGGARISITNNAPTRGRALALDGGAQGGAAPGAGGPGAWLAGAWAAEAPAATGVLELAPAPDPCPNCRGPQGWAIGRAAVYCPQCPGWGHPAGAYDRGSALDQTAAARATRADPAAAVAVPQEELDRAGLELAGARETSRSIVRKIMDSGGLTTDGQGRADWFLEELGRARDLGRLEELGALWKSDGPAARWGWRRTVRDGLEDGYGLEAADGPEALEGGQGVTNLDALTRFGSILAGGVLAHQRALDTGGHNPAPDGQGMGAPLPSSINAAVPLAVWLASHPREPFVFNPQARDGLCPVLTGGAAPCHHIADQRISGGPLGLTGPPLWVCGVHKAHIDQEIALGAAMRRTEWGPLIARDYYRADPAGSVPGQCELEPKTGAGAGVICQRPARRDPGTMALITVSGIRICNHHWWALVATIKESVR